METERNESPGPLCEPCRDNPLNAISGAKVVRALDLLRGVRLEIDKLPEVWTQSTPTGVDDT